MANEDLLKDASVSYENGNYFIVTLTDLNVNETYPLQFRWMYKDKAVNPNWSAVKLITTPGESEPNTPKFTSANVDVSQPEKIIITWDGTSDDVGNPALTNYDRVDIYIDGAPFDGTKAAYSFKSPGTTIIPAPAGTYQIVLYAVSKIGTLSPVSTAVTKTVTAIGEVVDPPTLPSGLSVTTAPFSVSVNWPGTYSSSSFSGFKSIDIYAVGSNLGSSVTSGISSTNLVASLTVQDTPNKTNIGLDNLRQALGLSINSDVYSASIYYYYNSVNKNGTKYGSPTYTRINSSSVIPTKANFVDLVSGVISIENLVAGSGNFASWMRVGSSSGGSRIELSAVNDFTNSGYTVQKGMVAYSSGGTEIFNLDTDAGTLSINGSGTFTGNLSVGSSNSIFKAEPATGIWLGNAAYADAPFRVSNNGVIRSTSGTIGGWTLGSTYLQGTNLKLDTSGITVGATSSSYFDISPSALTHRNSNGSASGKFTLTLGASPALTIDGTLTVGGSSVATSSDLSGYATTGSLSSGLAGKIASGGAASDVNSNTTTISGGKIRTGSISATGYTYTSGNFSDTGMSIDLDNSRIRSPQFAIIGANAYFQGDITGASGTFSGTLSSSDATLGNWRVNSSSYGSNTLYHIANVGTYWNGDTGNLYTPIFHSTVGSGSTGLYMAGANISMGDGSINFGTGSITTISSISATSTITASSDLYSSAGNIYTGSSSGTAATTSIGAMLHSSGYVLARRSVGTPLYANRNGSTSGTLVQFYYDTSNGGTITGSTTTTPSFSGTSDYRAKKNIQDYSGAVDLIKQTKPKSFIMKNDELEQTQVGFIAHEFAEIFPQFVFGEKDAVDEDGNPEYQSMSTTNLIPYLMAAVKELSARLDALEG